MEDWIFQCEKYLLAVVFIGCFAFLLIRQYLINRAPEYIGTAIVVSRRIGTAGYHGKWSSGLNYLVTFQVGNDTIELYVSQLEYQTLTEGTTGTLRWQNDNMLYFDPIPS